MPYEITALHDVMPTGRIRKAKADKYGEHKALLEQMPEGKVAQIALPQEEYRAFSAGMRAAGVQAGKKVESQYKSGHAFVFWKPLTEANQPKRRGGRRRKTAAEAGATATATV